MTTAAQKEAARRIEWEAAHAAADAARLDPYPIYQTDAEAGAGGSGLAEPLVLTQQASFQAGFVDGGHSAMGAGATVDPAAYFGSATSAVLNVKEAFAGTFNATQRIGQIIDLELDPTVHAYPTGAGFRSSWAQVNNIHSKVGNDKDIYEINAGYFRADHAGNGIVPMLAAIEGRVWCTGAGTVQKMYGGWFVVVNTAGHVLDAYGISIDRSFAVANIDNLYGLRIGDQSGQGSVRSENIRSEGVASVNVFEGSVEAGRLSVVSTDLTQPVAVLRHPTDFDSFPQIQAVTSPAASDYGRAELVFCLYNPLATVPRRKIIGFSADGYYHEPPQDGVLQSPFVGFYEYITNEAAPTYIFGLGQTVNHSKVAFKVGGFASNDVSAMLSVNSTTLGFLPPRMTGTERDAIVTPAAGLIIYNTTTGKLNLRNASAWRALTDEAA